MEPSDDEGNIAPSEEKNDNPLPYRISNALTRVCNQEKFIESSKILLDYINRELPKSSTDVKFPEGISFILRELISELSKDGVQNNACYATLQALLQLHSQIVSGIFPLVEAIFATENKNPLGYLLARGAVTKSKALLTNNDLLKVMIFDIGTMDYEDLNHIAGQFLFDLILKDTDGTIIKCAWNVHKNSLNQLVNKLTTCHKWLSVGLSKPEYKKYMILPEEFYKKIFGPKGFKSLCTTFKAVLSYGVNIYPIIETYYESFIAYEDEKFRTAYTNSDAECPGLDKMVEYCVSYIPNPGEHFSKMSESTILMIKHLLPYLMRPVHIAQVFSPRFLGFLVSDIPGGTIKLKNAIEDLIEAIFEKYIPKKEDPNCVTSIVLVRQLVLASGYVKLNNDNGTLSKIFFKALSTMDPILILRLATILIEIFENKTMDELDKFEPNAVVLTELFSHLLFQRGINSTDDIKLKAQVLLLIYRFCCLKLQSSSFSIVNYTLLKTFFTSIRRAKKLEDLIIYLEIIFTKIQAAPMFHKLNVDSKISEKFDKVYQLAADSTELYPSHQLTVMAFARVFMISELISNNSCPSYTYEICDLLEVVLQSKTSHEKCLKDDNCELTDDSNWVEATLKLCVHVLNQREGFWKKFTSAIYKFISPFIKLSALYIITDKFKCCPQDEEDKEHDSSAYNDDHKENGRKEEKEGEDGDSCNDDDDDSDDDDSDDDDDIDEEEEDAISQVKEKMMEIVGKVSDNMDDIELEDVKADELMKLDARLGAFFPDSDRKMNTKNPRNLRAQRRAKMETMKYCLRISSFIEDVIENAPSLDHLAFLIEPLLWELGQASEQKVFDHIVKKIRHLLVSISKRASQPTVRTQITIDLKEEMMKLFMMRHQLEMNNRQELELGYLFFLRCGIKLAKVEENERITDELYELFAQHTEAMIMNSSPYVLEKPLTFLTPSTSILLHKIVTLAFDSSLFMAKRRLCLELICYSFIQHDVIEQMPSNKLHDICALITKGIVKDFTPDLAPSVSFEKHLIRIVDMIKILRKRARRYSGNTIDFKEIMDAIVAFIDKFPDMHCTQLRSSLEQLKQIFNMQSNSGSRRLLRKKRYISDVEGADGGNGREEEEQRNSDEEILEKINTHLTASRQRRLKKIEARIDNLKSKMPEEILVVPVFKGGKKVRVKPSERIAQRRLRILQGLRENLIRYLENPPKVKQKALPKQTFMNLGARVSKKKKLTRSQRKKRKKQREGKHEAIEQHLIGKFKEVCSSGDKDMTNVSGDH